MFRAPARQRPHEQVLRLADRRLLGYTEYGDPEGEPVLYFHGWPGSRLEAAAWDAPAKAAQVRLVALERPGYGLSDFHPGHTIAGWTDDVAEAATLLGIEQFSVVGYSGGGPYALACGARLAGRVCRVACVSSPSEITGSASLAGMSLANRCLMVGARRAPWALGLPFGVMSMVVRRFPGLATRAFSRADRTLLATSPGLEAVLLRSAQEAFRHGVRGAADDGALLTRPWGFGLQEVSTEVLLWQGEADTQVPPSMGRSLASRLPHCSAEFIPGATHLWGPANGAAVLAAMKAGRNSQL